MTVTAELADGRRLEFPDGTEQSVIQSTVKRMIGGQPDTPVQNAPMGRSWFSDLSAAARDLGFPKVAAVAESVGQGLSSDQRGIGQILGRAVPAIAQQQAQDDTRLAGLRKEAGFEGADVGKFVGSMLSPVSVAAAGSPVNATWRYLARPGVGEAVKRGLVQGATIGAVSPVDGGEQMAGGDFLSSKLQQMGAGAALGAGGNVAGELLARPGAAAAGGGNTLKANILRDAGAEGYVFPPNMIAENGKGTVLQSLSGKIKTAQAASDRNQEVTNNLVRRALAMQPGQEISRETLMQIRRDAGQAYAAIANSGVNIVPDQAFTRATAGIGAQEAAIAAAAPSRASGMITRLREEISGLGEMNANTAVELVKRFRSDADRLSGPLGAATTPNANAESRALRSAATALEDLIGRNLETNGMGDLVPAFEAARVLIAKSHAVEKAVDSSGNVAAAKLVSGVKKGKATGELRLIGELADAFPKAVQNPSKLGGTLSNSPLDWVAAGGMGTIGAALGGSPMAMLGAGAMLARPFARDYVLSPSMQRQMLAQGVNRGLLRSPAIVPQLTGAGMGLLGAGLAP